MELKLIPDLGYRVLGPFSLQSRQLWIWIKGSYHSTGYIFVSLAPYQTSFLSHDYNFFLFKHRKVKEWFFSDIW